MLVLTFLVGDFCGKGAPQLPTSLQKYPTLEMLLADNNTLESLPVWIGMFKNLQQLWLGYNRLSRVVHDLSGCTSLTVLTLECNKLEFLPLSLQVGSGESCV